MTALNNKKYFCLWLTVAAAAGCLLFLFQIINISEVFKAVLESIRGLGAWGWGIFILIYVLSCILMAPGSVLTLGAGFLYGIPGGAVLVSVASTLGATAAFLAGRYLARERIARRFESNVKFKAMDEAVGKEGWKIVFLTRLSPVFPFNLLNYAYGLTQIKLLHYIAASWAGMIPGTFLYVYLGSFAGSLSALGTREGGKSAAEWGIYAVGFAATAAVTVLITKIAKKAMGKEHL